ncbi:TnsA-like heteromeric transposase endonuclease subunit [Mycobacterium heidelbergense]|uniref:TnsA-like heteromeric transposase endonuclease subunit n=1 Tax=Mycobacterium heidelbergense TaxID=53376 RepID=UPI003CE81ECB
MGWPVRRFSARKGQRHLSGSWWCATTSTHVGFESWLERDHLMLLDFDSAVVGIAAQPFWLSWPDARGSTVRHTPDYFGRRADGSAVVVDCRPVEWRRVGDLAKFEATAHLCARLGWEYRVVGGIEPVLAANVRWLAGYRHPRHHDPQVAQLLQEVFVTPTPLTAGARAVGDPDRGVAGVISPAVAA